MRTRLLTLSLLSASLVAASASAAGAQPADGLTARSGALQGALEIAITSGYTRSVGGIDGGTDGIDDLTGPGGHLELQIGYRIDPHLAVAAYGSATDYLHGPALKGSDLDLGAAATGVKADWHLAPTSATDPWLSLGTGVRWVAIEEGGAGQRHLFGLDMVRAQVGIDYRVNEWFSLAPVLGATATTFVSEDDAMTHGWQEIDDHKVSLSFQAGIMGRFELAARP